MARFNEFRCGSSAENPDLGWIAPSECGVTDQEFSALELRITSPELGPRPEDRTTESDSADQALLAFLEGCVLSQLPVGVILRSDHKPFSRSRVRTYKGVFHTAGRLASVSGEQYEMTVGDQSSIIVGYAHVTRELLPDAMTLARDRRRSCFLFAPSIGSISMECLIAFSSSLDTHGVVSIRYPQLVSWAVSKHLCVGRFGGSANSDFVNMVVWPEEPVREALVKCWESMSHSKPHESQELGEESRGP